MSATPPPPPPPPPNSWPNAIWCHEIPFGGGGMFVSSIEPGFCHWLTDSQLLRSRAILNGFRESRSRGSNVLISQSASWPSSGLPSPGSLPGSLPGYICDLDTLACHPKPILLLTSAGEGGAASEIRRVPAHVRRWYIFTLLNPPSCDGMPRTYSNTQVTPSATWRRKEHNSVSPTL